MTVVGRNVRVGRLEIDVIALDGPVVAVVEVRTRGGGSWQRPLDSIGPAKCARVRRAGESLWRTRFKANPALERMRFDVAGVSFSVDGRATVEYVRAAF